MPEPTHEISLRVAVSTPEQFSEVWQTFNLLANGLGQRGLSVGVSSYLFDRPEDVDPDLLDKVSVALREADVHDYVIPLIVSKLRDYGVIPKER